MSFKINTVTTIDCVKGCKQLPNDFIDLTVTSPPYDKLRQYNGFNFDSGSLAIELFRVTKPGGVVVWVVNDEVVDGSETGNSFRQALQFLDAGFKLNDTMYYQKTGSTFEERGRRYSQIIENMFVFTKGFPKTFNPIMDVPKLWEGSWGKSRQRQKDGSLKETNHPKCGAAKSGRDDTGKYGWKRRSHVWIYKSGGKFKHPDWDIAREHPATFPYKLAEDHIISWSNEGDVVFDPLCGSGTVGLAAKNNKRNFILFDVSEKYVELSKKRVGLK